MISNSTFYRYQTQDRKSQNHVQGRGLGSVLKLNAVVKLQF